MSESEVNEKLKRFEERMLERKPISDEQARQREQQQQDELRQDYLKRTGRKDLTP